LNRRQFIKTASVFLLYMGIPALPSPAMERQPWVDEAFTLFLRTTDVELLELEITFNGIAIETYEIKMFQEGNEYIHEIKIPKMYSTPGKIMTKYESGRENAKDEQLSLTDKTGRTFRNITKTDLVCLKRTVPAGRYTEVSPPAFLFKGEA